MQYEQTSATLQIGTKNNLKRTFQHQFFMAYKYDYNEERNSVEWQRKVDEIRRRDNYTCQICGAQDKQVQVHHTWYNPNLHYWDYPNKQLITLCKECHEKETILCQQFKNFKQHIDSTIWESLNRMMQSGVPLLKLANTFNLMGENFNFCHQTKPTQSTKKHLEINKSKYNLDEWKTKFVEEVRKFENKYGKDYVETFIDYWTEESDGTLRFDRQDRGSAGKHGAITSAYIEIKLENWESEYDLILKEKESAPILKELEIKLEQVEENYRAQNVELLDREDSGYYGVSDRLFGKLLFEKGLYIEKHNGVDTCIPITTDNKQLFDKSVFYLLYEAHQAFKENKRYNQTILESIDPHITYKSFCSQYNIKYPKNLKQDRSINEIVNTQAYPIKIEYRRGCVSLSVMRSTHRELFSKLNEVFSMKLLIGIPTRGGRNIPVPFPILYKMDGLQFDLRCDSFENGTMKSISLPSTFKDISYYIEEIEKIFQRH